jgi:5-formyltetrahydrofolate cyclo-ligase
MIQQSKKDLRREMKLVLSNLDPRWIAKAHTEVCSHLAELVQSLPLFNTGPRQVLAWTPFFQGEVDLAEFVGRMLKDSIVYLPRIGTAGGMEFVRIADDWGAHLVPGPRGIMQPAEGYGESFSREQSGNVFIVTPGLAFDPFGQRLGRGAGYYDRFMNSHTLYQAVKIGVCWSMQLVQTVPTDTHDVRMDWICYERGVIKTESSIDE